MGYISENAILVKFFVILPDIPKLLHCIVLFRQLPCLYILMGIVPSLIGSVYVYMYAVDSPKRQEEAMNTGSQSPSSF